MNIQMITNWAKSHSTYVYDIDDFISFLIYQRYCCDSKHLSQLRIEYLRKYGPFDRSGNERLQFLSLDTAMHTPATCFSDTLWKNVRKLLSEYEYEIVESRMYGMSFAEIAKEYGVYKNKIHFAYGKALKKLKENKHKIFNNVESWM